MKAKIYLTDMLREISTPNQAGEFPSFRCRYVCADGRVSEISDAQFIRLDKESLTLVLRVPGGARTLKYYGIVGYEDADIFL